jgi:drug efflux transport system ATP-binding protein
VTAADERTSSGPAVQFADVKKSFGATVAVDGLSFEVRTGEMFGVIGPDGAGKTTTLRLICGLLGPERGTVRVRGADPFRNHRAATAAIGYVSQRFSLYGDLSVDENIAFFASIHGARDYATRRTRLLDLTGLAAFRSRRADQLSGGMKQKLALACTLVHEPPILVLDEPTTGVDPVSRREFWKLLAEFLGQGLTIVLATPYLDEAERCARVALLDNGRLLALDAPERLQATMPGLILEVVAAPPRKALQVLRTRLGDAHVQLFGDRLHVRVDGERDGDGIVAALREAGIEAGGVRAIVPTLEDVFIELLASRTNP